MGMMAICQLLMVLYCPTRNNDSEFGAVLMLHMFLGLTVMFVTPLLMQSFLHWRSIDFRSFGSNQQLC